MMNPENRSSGNSHTPAVMAAATDLLRSQGLDPDARWLLVDSHEQRLTVLEGGQNLGSWTVSTSAKGLDNRQDSGGTPPGLHAIDRKLGHEAETGMIFASRRSTGILWRPHPLGPSATEQDLILTRILTLAGREKGLNQGPGVDSRERYIYIHGTNHEADLGTPASHGCIRMASNDVIDLFGLVSEGDPVVII